MHLQNIKKTVLIGLSLGTVLFMFDAKASLNENQNQILNQYSIKSDLYSIKPIDIEIQNKICASGIQMDLDFERIPKQKWNDVDFLLLLTCLKPQNSKIHDFLADISASNANDEVRYYAVQILSEVKPQNPAIHRKLLQVLKNDSNQMVKGMVAYAFAEIKPNNQEIVDTLVEIVRLALSKYFPHVRNRNLNIMEVNIRLIEMAAYALTKAYPNDDNAKIMFEEVMYDVPYTSLIRYAKNFLGKNSDHDLEVVNEFFPLISFDSSEDRRRIARELSRTNAQDYKSLRKLLEFIDNDSSAEVRLNAALTLSEIKFNDVKTGKKLYNLFLKGDGDPKVHTAVALALISGGFTSQEIYDYLIKTVEFNSDPEVRQLAARALISVKAKNPLVINAITKALINDTDEDIRHYIVSALDTEIQDPKIQNVLGKVLIHDSSESVRLAVVGRIKDSRFIWSKVTKSFIKALSSEPKSNIRSEIASTFFFMPTTAEIDRALMDRLSNDPDPKVRTAVASAYNRIASKGISNLATKALAKALINDKSSDVKYWASQAVNEALYGAKFTDSEVIEALTISLVINRAQEVRRHSILALKKALGFKPKLSLKVQSVLIDILLNESFNVVREKAAEILDLANSYNNSPKINKALSDALIQEEDSNICNILASGIYKNENIRRNLIKGKFKSKCPKVVQSVIDKMVNVLTHR